LLLFESFAGKISGGFFVKVGMGICHERNYILSSSGFWKLWFANKYPEIQNKGG